MGLFLCLGYGDTLGLFRSLTEAFKRKRKASLLVAFSLYSVGLFILLHKQPKEKPQRFLSGVCD